jgi:hypothetical protein
MNSVILNVGDLTADERQLYESALGQPLVESQKIVVQLVNPNAETSNVPHGVEGILVPYAMWANFSNEEVAELESAILDRSESRPT